LWEIDLMTAITSPPSVKFHLSLNVGDLDASVAFFRALFGREAAKCRPDYAKFELDEPPVVLSLEPHAGGLNGGALNHLGFRLADSAELVEWQRRLEMAGISTQREEGVECCYARQTKFWVRDPDNNLWEIYVLEEDIEHRGMGQTPAELPRAAARPAAAGPARAIWQHQLGTPLPAKIFAPDGSTAEVQLRGSFNAPQAEEERQMFLGEVFRILEPGGQVICHMLTGNQAITIAKGALPGPASYVTQVPALIELLGSLSAAGFEQPRMIKHGERPCFTHAGVEMRETMLAARKPA
jgi:catechol 2,3-dioxygenase-like lactoylglutathione lyase family enzyme